MIPKKDPGNETFLTKRVTHNDIYEQLISLKKEVQAARAVNETKFKRIQLQLYIHKALFIGVGGALLWMLNWLKDLAGGK